MTNGIKTRTRRALTHIKENADIYIPLSIFVTASSALIITGVVLGKKAASESVKMEEMLASYPSGSRVLWDIVNGTYVIAEPLSK